MTQRVKVRTDTFRVRGVRLQHRVMQQVVSLRYDQIERRFRDQSERKQVKVFE